MSLVGYRGAMTEHGLHWGGVEMTRDLEKGTWFLAIPARMTPRAAKHAEAFLSRRLREVVPGLVAVAVQPAVADGALWGAVRIAGERLPESDTDQLRRAVDEEVRRAIVQADGEQAADDEVAEEFTASLRRAR